MIIGLVEINGDEVTVSYSMNIYKWKWALDEGFTRDEIMDKLSDEYKDKANFYITDIEDAGINTGSAAGIRGVPTVIIYKKGQEVSRKVGGVPEGHMKEFLDENI